MLASFRKSVLFVILVGLLCPLAADTESGASDQSKVEAAAIEAVKKETKKDVNRKTLSVEQRNLLVGNDLHRRDGVYYKGEQAFRVGVTNLNVPMYPGWANIEQGEEAFAAFALLGKDRETLARAQVNIRHMEDSGSFYPNSFFLIWKLDDYAYSIYGERSFASLKQKIKESMVALREGVEREEFESFDDYINFKFGRDEDVESFADDYQIVASESDAHLTYFYTSEFEVESKDETIVDPMIGTSTYVIIKGKLLRIDVRLKYEAEDDVAKIIESTESVLRDLRSVNGSGRSVKILSE